MRARVLRFSGIFALTAAAGLFAGMNTAAACSCAGEPEPEDALRSADVVFEGTVLGEPEVVRAQLGLEGYEGAARFRFAVARYFKGQQGPEAAIYTIDQESACGRFYDAGATYLVYGRLQPSGALTDSLCSRTRLMASATADLALLGEGVPPEPGLQPRDVLAEPAEADSGCSAAPGRAAPAGSLAGALLFGLAALRRRRSR
jgi:uncharacterized protein (TIGR03382 family)